MLFGDNVAHQPATQAAAPDEIRFESAGTSLAATVTTPPGPGPFVGAVLIHGSGSSGRDNQWADKIARTLVQHGIAVLNPDKRGSGASSGDWKTVGFDALSADAHAAAQVLRRHPRVDPRRVGYVGLSQGGHFVPMTAATDAAAAFAVNLSGAAVTPGEQVVHEVGNNWRQSGAPPGGIEQGTALIRLANDFVRTGRGWDTYLAAREALRIAFGERVVATFPLTQDDWYWSWWRRVIDFDAVSWWSRVKVPGLVVYGADDEQDNVPVKASVARLARAGAEVMVVPGVGHSLTDPRTGALDERFVGRMVALINAVRSSGLPR
jgi:pimeloyl-ACP methyl ester carboxylesterase